MSSGVYQATALAIYTLQTYGPPAEKADTDKAVARAAAWLETAQPVTTQDRAFQLLGLTWAKAKPASITAPRRRWPPSNGPDGGWRQLPSMGSDAYATGRGALRAEHRRSGMVQRRGFCQRSEVSAKHASRRWVLAREVPFHLGATVFRKRVPLWPRSVDLRGRDGLGDDRTLGYGGAGAPLAA